MTTTIQQRPRSPVGTPVPPSTAPGTGADKDRAPNPAGTPLQAGGSGTAPLPVNHPVITIIDTNPGSTAVLAGLAQAETYFRMFPTEPSDGTINLAIDTKTLLFTITQSGDVNFENLLTLIKNACANTTVRSVLIVAHSAVTGKNKGNGLIMPITANSLDIASGDSLERLSRIGEVCVARDKIDETKLDQWKSLLNQAEDINLTPGASDNLKTAAEGKAQFNQWLQNVETKLGITKAKFGDLIKLRNDVRALKLDRVEMRCCDMGFNLSALGKLGKFLGSKTITAPDVETMYVAGLAVNFVAAKVFLQVLDKSGGRALFKIEDGFALRLVEGPSAFHYKGTVAAYNLTKLQGWLQKHVGTGYPGQGPLALGGLRSRPGDPPTAFPADVPAAEPIFAKDATYRQHLKTVTI